jgi:hypothetical protein
VFIPLHVSATAGRPRAQKLCKNTQKLVTPDGNVRNEISVYNKVNENFVLCTQIILKFPVFVNVGSYRSCFRVHLRNFPCPVGVLVLSKVSSA